MKKSSKIIRFFIPLISGIIMAISFNFKSFWWLSFFGLVPFFMLTLGTEYSTRKFLRYIFLLSFGYYVPLMLWLNEICAVLPIKKGYAIGILFFCILLIAFLQFQEYTPILAFPWAKIGVIESEFSAFIQSASLFGTLFISFLVIFLNGCIAFFILHIHDQKKATLSAIIFTLVFVGNISFGVVRIHTEKADFSGESFDGMVVQGNFCGLDKWKSSSSEMFEKYLALTRENATDKTKLVVWPETAIPTNFYKNEIFQKELSKLSKELDATLVVGFFINEGGEQSYNSLIAISPDGEISIPYYKQILAPFGEYFPFANFFKKILPSLSGIIDGSTGYLKGENPQIIDTNFGKIGGIICYESIFSKIARTNVENGAEILAIASNDSWFGESSALYQHHSHAIMRAVETNRFVLRASNTGISSIISPLGEVLNQAKSFKASTATAKIFLTNKKTLYTKIGDIIAIPCLIIFIFSIIMALKKDKTKAKK